MTDAWLDAARRTYVDVNRDTLGWILDRPRRHGAFLDTKMNSITLEDFPEGNLWRGPRTTYGWIQGRGLEALVTHARFFEDEDPAFARRLHAAARPLFAALAGLYDRHDAAFFAYDDALAPVIRDAAGAPVPQATGTGIATYSDLFVLKGLVAAATAYDPALRPRYLARLDDAIAAIDGGRFLMDEWQRLGPEALAAQAPEFGPRMIAMGAAAMLVRLGLRDRAGFGARYVDHILARHLDAATGLVRDAEGGDRANVGHAVEFAGFALEYLPDDTDPALVARITGIVADAAAAGLTGPGLCLHVDVASREPASRIHPWWSLPETIRAAAFALARTGEAGQRAIWRRAHDLFFANYWRGTPPLAYQTRTPDGPVDHVPATSDLDPGYHTGLSLLGAIEAIDALKRAG